MKNQKQIERTKCDQSAIKKIITVLSFLLVVSTASAASCTLENYWDLKIGYSSVKTLGQYRDVYLCEALSFGVGNTEGMFNRRTKESLLHEEITVLFGYGRSNKAGITQELVDEVVHFLVMKARVYFDIGLALNCTYNKSVDEEYKAYSKVANYLWKSQARYLGMSNDQQKPRILDKIEELLKIHNNKIEPVVLDLKSYFDEEIKKQK